MTFLRMPITATALLLSFSVDSSSALVVPNRLYTHKGAPSLSASSTKNPNTIIKMDLETPNTRESELMQRWKMSPFLRRLPQQNNKGPFPVRLIRDRSSDRKNNQQSAKSQPLKIPERFLRGMPWRSSIDPSYAPNKAPYYMNFWEHQLQFMKENLTNLQVLPVVSPTTGSDLSYRESGSSSSSSSSDQPMRMHTLLFRSDEFRLIRLTVMDAGTRTQVFTSVWYPQPKYNTPVMGVDLLQFGGRKHLCIMDFQPIHGDSDDDAACEYEHLMAPIRDQYPSLHGKMTPRFYDETSFFSSQMLLGRQEEPEQADRMIKEDFFPAFQGYLQTYMDLHRETVPRPDQVSVNLKRQQAYDVYSAERDPAHALLSKCFGEDFATDYVFNILFPFSKAEPKA